MTYRRTRQSVLILVLLLCLPAAATANQAPPDTATAAGIDSFTIARTAFPNKLIFAETPELGTTWRGGIRAQDFVSLWDVYWNLGDIATVDLTYASLRWMFRLLQALEEQDTTAQSSEEPPDSLSATDCFGILGIKSRPLVLRFGRNAYKVGGGMKFHWADFELRSHGEQLLPADRDRAISLFVTQGLILRDRHYFNLYTSMAFRLAEIKHVNEVAEIEKRHRLLHTYYVVPGYRVYIGRTKRWSFGAEYYVMNPVQLPLKILQYAFDADNNEFYNPSQHMVNYLFWGFSYASRHVRVDLTLGHHPSLAGPLFPVFGFGWNF